MANSSVDDDTIDLTGIVLWWLPYRWTMIFVAAFAGYLIGWYQESKFVSVYTAEAQVYIRSWAEQLDKVATRGQIAIVMPGERYLFQPEERGAKGVVLTATSPDRAGALAGVEAAIAKGIAAADEQDKSLAVFVDHLRTHGMAEVNLARPNRVEILSAPQVVGKTEPRPLALWFAWAGALVAIVAGFVAMAGAAAWRAWLVTSGREVAS